MFLSQTAFSLLQDFDPVLTAPTIYLKHGSLSKFFIAFYDIFFDQPIPLIIKQYLSQRPIKNPLKSHLNNDLA